MWVAVIFLLPALLTIVTAFTPAQQSGIVPFLAATTDTAVRASLVKTAAFAVAAVSVQMVVGAVIGLAIGMLQRFRIGATALISIPLFMPPIVVGLLWRWLLDTSRPGSFLGHSFAPLSDPRLALPFLGLISSWQWTPFVALVIATTMARLPRTIVTTATLDGLSLGAIFRVVIWPHIRHAFYWTLAWRLLDTIRTFDLIYVVTQGGPGSSTELLSFLVFQRAFVFLDRTEAAGAATVLLMMSLVLLFAVTRAALGSGDAASKP